MHTNRLQPWIDRCEFESVYQELYSDDSLYQEHALGRIAVWQSRFVTKVPLAVERTADFVRVRLVHQSKTSLYHNDESLRSLYGMAVVRFVNHITERRQKQTYAQDISKLAQQLGVPDWMVDLRHDVTHGILPSLELLSKAADWALAFLKHEYWHMQIAGTDVSEEDVQAVIIQYQQTRFEDLQKSKKHKHVQGLSEELTAQLDTMTKDDRSVLVDCLADQGCMLATEDQLMALDLQGYLERDEDLRLPTTLSLFWSPLLQVLQRSDSTALLLDVLLKAVNDTETTELEKRLSAGWICEILSVSYGTQSKMSLGANSSHICNENCASIQWMSLFNRCVQSPSRYTARILQSILPHLTSLSIEQKEAVTNLITVYVCNKNFAHRKHSTSAADDTHNDHIFTTADICVNLEDSIKAKSSPVTEVFDWSLVPFGCVPGVDLGYGNLELPCLRAIYIQSDRDGESSAIPGHYVNNHLHDRQNTAEAEFQCGIETCIESMDCDQSEKTANQHTWTDAQMKNIKERIKLL